LDVAVTSPLPVPSLLSQFRRRLGAARHQQLFDGIVAQGRCHGVVNDRLRLKDATHVSANIAIPSPIQLVAQVREQLLRCLAPYASQQVAVAQEEVAHMRQVTSDRKDEERLVQRVTHLHHIVAWGEEVQRDLIVADETDTPHYRRLEAALTTAHKLLADQEAPEGSDRLRSAIDVDARLGKHGAYYHGYACDISLDPDSELLTALKVLPANGDEAADARFLIEAEHKAQGNQVEALSIDSVGFQGAVLRDLSDPADLNLTVYVPPHSQGMQETPYVKPDDFHLSADGTRLPCPRGEETARRHRTRKDTAWVFQFARGRCATCPLLERCMDKLPAKHGRTVAKNDYHAEYEAARHLAETEAFAQVRQQHPKVERKLAEIVRYHGGRRARYWGRQRVKIQYLLIGIAVNIKRIVRLLGQGTVVPDLTPA
jgi:hypothetical protein